MNLFLKGFIIGIAKVIPGVSGAILAVSFNIYDRLINSITNFFDNKKDNFNFLLFVGSGILLAIVFFSNIIRYLINSYYIELMMLFIGLIIGGTLSYSRNVKFNVRNIFVISLVLLFMFVISFGNVGVNSYVVSDNFLDYVMFFIGGVVEILTSIVPGISGTAIYMLIGMYDNILMLFANILNISFVIDNILLYISFGIGMVISFVFFSILISYLIKKYRNIFDTIVFSLSLSSIILLIGMTFNSNFSFISMFVGVLLFFVGLVISYLFEK